MLNCKTRCIPLVQLQCPHLNCLLDNQLRCRSIGKGDSTKAGCGLAFIVLVGQRSYVYITASSRQFLDSFFKIGLELASKRIWAQWISMVEFNGSGGLGVAREVSDGCRIPYSSGCSLHTTGRRPSATIAFSRDAPHSHFPPSNTFFTEVVLSRSAGHTPVACSITPPRNECSGSLAICSFSYLWLFVPFASGGSLHVNVNAYFAVAHAGYARAPVLQHVGYVRAHDAVGWRASA